MSFWNFIKNIVSTATNNVNRSECGCPSTNDLTASERALLNQVSKINATGAAISPELYQQLRDYEMAWLERHYDFNTVEGINAIPVSANTPGAPAPKSPIKGHTGEVYYYLRHKAYKYEESGQMDLALACMRKSVALVKCRNYYALEDCYPLVKMLARAGYIDEAYQEKDMIDRIFSVERSSADTEYEANMIAVEAQRGQEARDYRWIQDNIPDKCPKSLSGYRRMKTQNTKNYQALQQAAAELGRNI